MLLHRYYFGCFDLISEHATSQLPFFETVKINKSNIFYRLNLYSIASEDITENESPLIEQSEEQSSDCDGTETESKESTDTTQSATINTAKQSDVLNDNTFEIHVPDDKTKPADTSIAFINFSIVESQIDSVDVEGDKNTKLNKTTSGHSGDLINFTMTIDQTDSNVAALKSQPSDCSVITLSSEESQSQLNPTQETLNKSIGHDDDDEDLFEKSIRSPPSQLPDDLFETSCTEKGEDNDEVEAISCKTDGKLIKLVY